MRWKSVVLPAPLGPISPVTEPRLTSSVAPWTARIPPKCLCTSATTRMRSLPSPSAASRRSGVVASSVRAPVASLTEHHLLAPAEDPLRAERHQQDQREPDDDEAKRGDLVARQRQVDRPRRLEQELHEDRPDDYAGPAAESAQDE